MNDSEVFDKHVLHKLFRYAYSLCVNEDDAYDLLHYALEKYLHNQSSSKQGGAVAYVRTIIRHRFIDEYRKKKRFPEEVFDEESAVAIDVSSLEDIVLAQVELEAVWQKIDPFEREILYYWTIEGMTAQEISQQIGVPRGTVLSRIYRLRKKIQLANNDVVSKNLNDNISRGNKK